MLARGSIHTGFTGCAVFGFLLRFFFAIGLKARTVNDFSTPCEFRATTQPSVDDVPGCRLSAADPDNTPQQPIDRTVLSYCVPPDRPVDTVFFSVVDVTTRTRATTACSVVVVAIALSTRCS